MCFQQNYDRSLNTESERACKDEEKGKAGFRFTLQSVTHQFPLKEAIGLLPSLSAEIFCT